MAEQEVDMARPGERAILAGLGDVADGGPELDWAAREAQVRDSVVHLVRTWDKTVMALPWEDATDREIRRELRHDAETRLRWATQYLHNKWPGVRVEPEVVEGRAARALIDRSAQAELTVLGSRRLGSIGSALLGSVSTVVAARAPGPVVVVRGTEGEPVQEPAVVVGVDGSKAMHDVLSFAFDYASRHHRPVHAVFCYRRDLLTTSPRRFRQPSAEQADRWLGAVTAGWQEKYPDVRLERVVIREHPVSALVTQSQGQDLLVVGSHAGRGRVASALGSVSQGVLHHAKCPVAIVPLADTG